MRRLQTAHVGGAASQTAHIDSEASPADQTAHRAICMSDLPHFAFLGCGEEELPTLGLKKVIRGKREFWVPDPARAPGSGL